MVGKLIVYLLIVGVVCTIIGGITDVGFFNAIGVIGFSSAGVIFLIWVFGKMFFKNK